MTTTRVLSVTVPVADRDAALAFSTGVLGCELRYDVEVWPRARMVEAFRRGRRWAAPVPTSHGWRQPPGDGSARRTGEAGPREARCPRLRRIVVRDDRKESADLDRRPERSVEKGCQPRDLLFERLAWRWVVLGEPVHSQLFTST
jgi:catechol 2,3-dioxygenase-like lactoylglutathione lyase family enzyme